MMDQVVFNKAEMQEELTTTEKTYLRLLAAGMTKKEMAAELHKSEATVNSHITHIQQKLNAKNGPSIVARAIARGLLQVSLICFLLCVFSVSDDDDFRRPTRSRRQEYQLTQQGISLSA